MNIKTPVLYIDRQKLKNNYRTIQQALPQVHIAYAIKSNSHPEIISILQKEENAFFETASLNEILFLISQGVSPQNILFSNPIKPFEAVQKAIELGVKRTTIDSLAEAEKLIPLKDNLDLYLRLIVSNQGSLWPLVGKFGLGITFWRDMFLFLQKHKIPLKGISFHVGSQCQTSETWKNAMQTTWKAIQIAKEYNLHPTSINIGGGFPIELTEKVPTIFEIANVITEELSEWEKDGFVPEEIFAEPGRFISGSAGFLTTQIIGTAERDLNGLQKKKWVYLDVGVFNGMMETIDGFKYPIFTSGNGEYEEVTLCGPSCDSVDKMFEVQLPKPENKDILFLMGAGAYTNVYASNFNGFEMPSIEFIDSTEKFFKNLAVDLQKSKINP